MIKKFSQFIIDKPKLYDYVILNMVRYSFNYPEFNDYLNNNIGQIIEKIAIYDLDKHPNIKFFTMILNLKNF